MMMYLVDPTAGNLPFWSIGILVGAVATLFGILITFMRSIDTERKGLQTQLTTANKLHQTELITARDKMDEVRKEFAARETKMYYDALQEQKDMAILLNDAIQMMDSLSKDK